MELGIHIFVGVFYDWLLNFNIDFYEDYVRVFWQKKLHWETLQSPQFNWH